MMTQLLLSAAFGIPFGGALYLIYQVMGVNIGFPLMIFAMVFSAALCFLFMILYQKILNRRYANLEAQIPYPIFYRTNGNFDLGSGIKNGNLYFCDAGIVCVSMEKKPYTLDEILVQDISMIRFDAIHLHIHTRDGRFFKITTADAPIVIELLKERNWVE